MYKRQVVIEDDRSGLNGIIIKDTDYTISDAEITMKTDADGTDTCDFSGKGSAVAVFGDSDVLIEDSTIHTAGVATMPIFADDGATVTVDDSVLRSDGGTLYGDYMNSPDQATMVAPPWILGIMGTSRTTNLMGNNSTMNVTDSETSAGAWAVLSTDSGRDMVLNLSLIHISAKPQVANAMVNGELDEVKRKRAQGGCLGTKSR